MRSTFKVLFYVKKGSEKPNEIYAKITAQKISQDMETLSHKLEDMEKNRQEKQTTT